MVSPKKNSPRIVGATNKSRNDIGYLWTSVYIIAKIYFHRLSGARAKLILIDTAMNLFQQIKSPVDIADDVDRLSARGWRVGARAALLCLMPSNHVLRRFGREPA